MSKTPVSYSKKSFITSFKRKHPQQQIADKEIEQIIDATGKAIADILMEDGEVKLASRLGPLMIRKFKPKGKGGSFAVSADKNKSKLAGKTVYQFNDHSDGYIFKFVWNKKLCKSVSDKNMWVFKPIRSIKRRLAQVIKSKSYDYPVMMSNAKEADL